MYSVVFGGSGSYEFMNIALWGCIAEELIPFTLESGGIVENDYKYFNRLIMREVKILLFALVALFATSCVHDLVDEGVAPSTDVAEAGKFVNSPDGAIDGELLIYVNEDVADEILSGRSDTRSGNSALDALADELGAESIKPIFNMAMNADKKIALGLHRWYVVRFDEDSDLEGVARKFAALPEISRIQYNSRIENPRLQASPLKQGAVQSRALNMPFDDPNLPLQWHYDNRADVNLYGANTPVEGADISAFEAWKYTTGNPEVVVAVLDEGVFYDHPDLKANMWVNAAERDGAAGVDDDGNGFVDDIYGINTVTGDGNITWNASESDSGHGTHVAGTIAAVNNNGIGVSGVAGGSGNGDGVRIMSCQIFSGDKSSGLLGTVMAADYAADMGACILQNSWGYESDVDPNYGPQSDAEYTSGYSIEYQAFQRFRAESGCSAMSGNVVIFAAGNMATPKASYPGAYNEFISVTSYSADGLPSYYTNYNVGCNVAAPGGEFYILWKNGNYEYVDAGCVLSTVPSDVLDVVTGAPYNEDYAYMQGTSMACPHVSGVAALVLSYAVENGIKLTSAQLTEILTSSVVDIDSYLTGTKVHANNGGTFSLASYKGKMGTGRLDAFLAIMNVRGATCVATTVGQEIEIDINKICGDGNLSMTALREYVIPEDVRTRLGIINDTVFGNKLILTCTKPGCGVVTMNFVAGGSFVGGGQTIGGMKVQKEIALVSRVNNNTEGWL